MRTIILANTGPTTLTGTWYEDGVAVDAGDVTIGVVDLDGNEIVEAGTATTKSGSGEETRYTYDLPIQSEVKSLTVTWTRSSGASLTDRVEVVGNHLFSIADMRAFDGGEYSDTDSYTTDTIAQARAYATDFLEQATKRSWVPRFGRTVVSGSGYDTLTVPHFLISSVLAVDVDGTAWTSDEIARIAVVGRHLILRRGYWPRGAKNITISYRYGYEDTDPSAARAALIAAADFMTADNIDPFAERMTDDGTTVVLSHQSPKVTAFIEANSWKKVGTIPL